MSTLEHTLSRLVPLEIARVQRDGGLNLAHITALAGVLPIHESVIVGEASAPEYAPALKVVIEALAQLAFLPGGVRFGSLHFEVQHDHP